MLESIEALASYAPAERLERDRFMVALGAVENEVSNGFARIPTTNSGEPRMCAADAEAMLKAIAEENWEFFDGIRERYMPLPVDRKGEAWRIGDKFPFAGEGGKKYVCTVSGIGNGEVFFYYDQHADSTKHRHIKASGIVHDKPRTVEEVLREFAKSGTPTGEGGLIYTAAIIKKYADELRNMFGGDAR